MPLTTPLGDARYRELAARFRPVFARIGIDALEREKREDLAREQLGWLVDAGFARLRTPVELGGLGARLSDLLLLIAELAEVDVNLAHIWRNHFSFVEDRLHALDDPRSREWLERLGRGEIVGGGWSEAGAHTQSTVSTRIEPDGDGWVVTGTKVYATGSVYADWFTVLALTPEGEKVIALVPADQPGVVVGDDWDGFGQRLTGSGTVTYDRAVVAEGDAIPYASRYTYQAQYYQGVLHALLAGIGRAALRDGVDALRSRTRNHDNGTTVAPTADPQLLEVIGRVSSLVFAADSALAVSARLTDELLDAAEAAESAQAVDAAEPARTASAPDPLPSWLAVAQSQSVITDSVLAATTLVFDALGASGTTRELALDRHWRNARTLASHNPRVFRLRLVGDALVTGADPTAH